MYDRASDYCRRVAAKVVVPGCKQCNAVMNRANAHVDIVYRCFPHTSKLHIPELEDGLTRTGKVISKGITVKKLVQQVAFYFKPTASASWQARDDGEIMPLVTLWRCVAYLCMWGRNSSSASSARFRVVATFYASFYIYEKLILKDMILFNDWHLHVFRPFYISSHAPATFFGMTQGEAALIFNTTQKAGPLWCEVVEKYLHEAADKVDAYFRCAPSLFATTHHPPSKRFGGKQGQGGNEPTACVQGAAPHASSE